MVQEYERLRAFAARHERQALHPILPLFENGFQLRYE
jgi:hypothetical protein